MALYWLLSTHFETAGPVAYHPAWLVTSAHWGALIVGSSVGVCVHSAVVPAHRLASIGLPPAPATHFCVGEGLRTIILNMALMLLVVWPRSCAGVLSLTKSSRLGFAFTLAVISRGVEVPKEKYSVAALGPPNLNWPKSSTVTDTVTVSRQSLAMELPSRVIVGIGSVNGTVTHDGAVTHLPPEYCALATHT